MSYCKQLPCRWTRPDVFGFSTLSFISSFLSLCLCSYYNLCRFNERFERAYVLQAKEDVAWQKRQKECLDNERKLMSGVEGWVVNKPRFFTQAEKKPDMDVLDARKVGPW